MFKQIGWFGWTCIS